MQGPGQQADHDIGFGHMTGKLCVVADIQMDDAAIGVVANHGRGPVRRLIGKHHLQPAFFKQVANRRACHQAGTQDQYLFHHFAAVLKN